MIRFELMLIPFSSVQMRVIDKKGDLRNYTDYYLFGFRIIRLHNDR